MTELQIGQLAPEFELPSSEGGTFKLLDHRGQNVILYFYPKDMTPGCTTEACDFRDFHPEFGKSDTVVIGISADDLTTHNKFKTKHELPFPLLSDEDHQVSEQYGVWKLKKMYGKEFYGIERSTFLIDKEGKLRKEWRKVSVKNHVEDVLAAVKEL